jgi:hypothetical protein
MSEVRITTPIRILLSTIFIVTFAHFSTAQEILVARSGERAVRSRIFHVRTASLRPTVEPTERARMAVGR